MEDMQAEIASEHLLQKCREEGRSPADREVLEILEVYNFMPNRSRKNIQREEDELSGGFVYSDTLGLVPRRGEAPDISKNTSKHPTVCRVLCKWLYAALPDATFTSVTLNKKVCSARHRDRDNEGPSVARALFNGRSREGGDLLIWPRDNRKVRPARLNVEDAVTIDTYTQFQLFDGRDAHEVTPCRLEKDCMRFSIIFFTTTGWRSASEALVETLRHFDFNWPSQESVAKMMLAVQRGPGAVGAKRKSDHIEHAHQEEPAPQAATSSAAAQVATQKHRAVGIARPKERAAQPMQVDSPVSEDLATQSNFERLRNVSESLDIQTHALDEMRNMFINSHSDAEEKKNISAIIMESMADSESFVEVLGKESKTTQLRASQSGRVFFTVCPRSPDVAVGDIEGPPTPPKVSVEPIALRNYEQFHNLPRGTATIEQVRQSSAGVHGWSTWGLPMDKRTEAASARQCSEPRRVEAAKDRQPSVQRRASQAARASSEGRRPLSAGRRHVSPCRMGGQQNGTQPPQAAQATASNSSQTPDFQKVTLFGFDDPCLNGTYCREKMLVGNRPTYFKYGPKESFIYFGVRAGMFSICPRWFGDKDEDQFILVQNGYEPALAALPSCADWSSWQEWNEHAYVPVRVRCTFSWPEVEQVAPATSQSTTSSSSTAGASRLRPSQAPAPSAAPAQCIPPSTSYDVCSEEEPEPPSVRRGSSAAVLGSAYVSEDAEDEHHVSSAQSAPSASAYVDDEDADLAERCHYFGHPNMDGCVGVIAGTVYMRARNTKNRERNVCQVCLEWCLENTKCDQLR